MSEFWFARRFPLGSMRSGMAPVHWKGWAIAVGFVVALALSAAFGAWLISIGQTLRGAAAFGMGAFAAALSFIAVAHKKGDHINCVADYRKGKLSA
jgi:hypothetical protein